jgi:xanthine dehydrogenase YagS FAD-binding subunit
VGGNLLQRTRCPYFNDASFGCNKRQAGSGCPAVGGFHRGLAILGTSDQCIASNPSDMNVALAAINPLIRIQGASGKIREIEFGEFHLIPGNTPELETLLKPGELILSVDLPHLPYAEKSKYLKIRDRASYEFALVSVALLTEVAGGVFKNVRVAFGGVGTKPWRSPEAEKVLTGAPLNEEVFKAAGEAAMKDARPGKQNAFKVELAKRTLTRALREMT